MDFIWSSVFYFEKFVKVCYLKLRNGVSWSPRIHFLSVWVFKGNATNISKCQGTFFVHVLHMIKGFFLPMLTSSCFFFSALSRLQAGGLAFTSYQEHKAVWLGQKSNVFFSRLQICLHSNYHCHLVFSAFHPFGSLFPFPLQYVVVSSKKILFYNSELDREQANPFMTLEIEWVI